VIFHDFARSLEEPADVHYAIRHRLEKQDPTAAVSDPIKPIVYYLDRGAPEPMRTALLEGARWWNKAFEAAGFRNAFQVELLPEDADPIDIRYNMIIWVPRTTRGFSTGTMIWDPRTGEILKGEVMLTALRDRHLRGIAEALLSPYEDGTPCPAVNDLMVARLRQLSAHEVGHTLGLDHNHVASTFGQDMSVGDVADPEAPRMIFKPRRCIAGNAWERGWKGAVFSRLLVTGGHPPPAVFGVIHEPSTRRPRRSSCGGALCGGGQ
jgi:hypothetical protein